MIDADVMITPWGGDEVPSESAVRRRMAAEGLRYYAWSNGPGDRYSAHSHSWHKIIYVALGSITFELPESGRRVELAAGDRLDLPAGVQHSAVVGPSGVLCLEAKREP